MADEIKAGIYEIRSYLAPSALSLDVKGANLANGENLWVFSTLEINTQKFVLADEGDGWSIKCYGSNKYVDVAGGRVENDTNVQIWSNLTSEGGVSRNQRWKATLIGTTEVDGVTCQVVRFGAANEDRFRMDVQGAIGFSTCNVQIFEASELDCQKWVLVPTTPISDDLPTPYDMALANALGNTSMHAKAGKLYPRFKVAYSKGSTYLWRCRTRKMATSGIWGDWTAWTAWTAPSGIKTVRESASSNVRTVWIRDTVDCSFDFDDCKRMECQMELRTLSADGGFASRTCTAYEASTSAIRVSKNVNTTFSGAYWSPLGLRVECSNDFENAGELTYDVIDMRINGGVNWEYVSHNVWENGSFLLDQAAMGGIPAEGDTVRFLYYTWQDMAVSNNLWQTSPTLTVAYDGGTVDVTPTVMDGDGATMVATVPYVQTVRMWVMCDGEMIELTGTESDGKTSFTYEYPFGKDYKLFTAYTNADGSEWGTDETDMPARDIRAHAWNWDGGWLVLWLDTDLVKESRDYSLSADTHTLAGRSKPVVSILSDSNGDSYMEVSGSVSGVLLPDDRFGCTTDSVESLMKQGFARYRSPNGRMVNVAVTGGSVEVNHAYASVSIDQTEVSS